MCIVRKNTRHTIVYKAMYATMQMCAQVGAEKLCDTGNRSRVGVADIRR